VDLFARIGELYAALRTFPDFKHPVQTYTFFFTCPTMMRTRCRFGIQRRRVRLWAWLMLFPLTGPLPQISQTLAMIDSPALNELVLMYRKENLETRAA